MTKEEYLHLLDIIQRYYDWNHMQTNSNAGRVCVKYVIASYDTRDGSIWMVKLSGCIAPGTGKKYNLGEQEPEDTGSQTVTFSHEGCTFNNILNWLRSGILIDDADRDSLYFCDTSINRTCRLRCSAKCYAGGGDCYLTSIKESEISPIKTIFLITEE